MQDALSIRNSGHQVPSPEGENEGQGPFGDAAHHVSTERFPQGLSQIR